MSGTPEFSRRVKLARIGAEPYRQQISATDAERAALARRFDLVSLDRLEAAVELIPIGGERTILLRADFEAAFEQRCIVTLDPIAGVLAERFELLYGPPEAEETASSLVGEDVAFEPLVGDEIDIGEAVAQEFSLALPPFPRSPEIRVETETESESPPRRFQSVCRADAACRSRRRQKVRRLRFRVASTTLPGFARCTPSLLPQPRNLAKYRNPSRSPFRPGFAAERYEERSSRRDDHGCSEKENLALAPQHAAVASRAERAGLYRMPRLRRAEAAASPLPVLRPLRRARSRAAAGHDIGLSGAAPARRAR